MDYNFQHAILGGTFDHFHLGHKTFLDSAFNYGSKITIGISLSELYQHKQFSNVIEDYSVREAAVESYLSEKNYTHRAHIIQLSDIFGIGLNTDVDAIIVTSGTRKNAEFINKKRGERKLSPLVIEEVPLVFGDDKEAISSERIRAGEIDRNGNSYRKIFFKKRPYILPEALKDELREPIGIVIKDPHELPSIIGENVLFTIGDMVSIYIREAGLIPNISIIDFKTRRHEVDLVKIHEYFSEVPIAFSNPAGTINTNIAKWYFDAAQDSLKKTGHVIAVEGEEDLLALPIMLFAPLHSFVVYGLYDVGMVIVEITEQKKEYVKNLLMQFK